MSGEIFENDSISTRMRASSRWALGSLILTVLVTSEISGLSTIIALPIAAINAFLSALCDGDLETYNLITKTPRRFRSTRNIGDFFEFLSVWYDLLTSIVACATCARCISATVDYMTAGRSSDWLLGIQSHSLGEPWPDILAIAIVLVINFMFMFGLENSFTFFIILNTAIVGCLVFFVTLGLLYADLEYWKRDSFMPENCMQVFITAAACAFGFSDKFPEHKNRKKRYQRPLVQLFLIILLQLFTYIIVTLFFTLMSYFHELVGTAVPMVRMFEARDVDWARPVMASFTIVIIAIVLMEFCPSMFDTLLELAGKDWNVLTKAIMYQNDTTNSPVLAIFATGSLAAILAFVCPLSYLICTLNIGPLIKHIMDAMAIIYYRYQPHDGVEDFPICDKVEYCKLSQGVANSNNNVNKPTATTSQKSGIKARILTGSWFLPKSMRKSRAAIVKDIVVDRKNYRKDTRKEDEESEYLLMGAYSPEPQEITTLSVIRQSESNMDSNSELELVGGAAGSDDEGNDLTTITAHSTDEDSRNADNDDSNTDIDAVVQEYKERVKVSTVLLKGSSAVNVRLPSLASGRFVLGASFGVCAWSIALSVGIIFDKISIIGGSLSGALILIAMITAQPQMHLEHTFNQPISHSLNDVFYSMDNYLIPLIPCCVIILNIIMSVMIINDIWIGILLWFVAGLVLFVRCDECFFWCWDCLDPENASIIIHHHQPYNNNTTSRKSFYPANRRSSSTQNLMQHQQHNESHPSLITTTLTNGGTKTTKFNRHKSLPGSTSSFSLDGTKNSSGGGIYHVDTILITAKS